MGAEPNLVPDSVKHSPPHQAVFYFKEFFYTQPFKN